MKTTIFNMQGKSAGDIDLPAELFDLPMNEALVHQVYTSMMSNKRTNIAHTKDRSEVRGGGKKPWKQKGTGRARHGSNRSPIWIGGGITFGPRNEQNFKKKINKKMKQKALLTVISQKMRDGEIVFVDSVSFDTPKTKDANAMLSALAKATKIDGLENKVSNRALIATSTEDKNVMKSFANISAVSVDEMRKVNVVDLLHNRYLVVSNPAEFVEMLAAKLAATPVTN